MRARLIAVAAAAMLLTPAAYAQEGTAAGIAGGAATGAVLGGPVGAVIGAAGGAILGTAIDPPPAEVVTYVDQQPATASVAYQGDIVVGEPLPEVVTVHPIPQHQTYRYAVVNGQRVIVDANTRQVVQVVN